MQDPSREDPQKKKKEEKDGEKDKQEGSSKLKKDGKDGKEEEGEELSEEDIQLRTELEMLVERLKESNTDRPWRRSGHSSGLLLHR
ncbi:uncharacterized protein ARMOST_17784 [Armillaria ostoyae]|uniref:Uncharacterized protein n=1 Tax=Armillaria ostoyae TaxID=47428 RepID=A0A284RZX9_ARMOS|nr:uncharacterized protein ARMOST_17784 [Armillaria ostoyae]